MKTTKSKIEEFVGPRFHLRLDWSRLPVQSQLSKRIQESQTIHPHCRDGKNPTTANRTNVQFWKFQATRYFGMGASLHVWSQHICNAMEADKILLWRDHWNWNFCQEDHKRLGFQYDQRSCYFQNNKTRDDGVVATAYNNTANCDVGHLVPQNEQDPRVQRNIGIDRWGLPRNICDNLLKNMNATTNDFRAAAMEWLFSSVHDRVIDEAKRQAREAFGEDGLPNPEDMVTVHVRWGDKKSEMELVSIEEYINATKAVTATRKTKATNETLHVYLATEDQDVIEQFKKKSPPNWRIHLSGPVTPRDNIIMTKFASGDTGLQSLGALLLSLESNYFVLTLASNWSMLINELRKTVVNPRCGKCTRMVRVNSESWR